MRVGRLHVDVDGWEEAGKEISPGEPLAQNRFGYIDEG